MTGWLPIESAPKDGTLVDLWMVDESGKGWREADAYYVTETSETVVEYKDDGSSKYVSRKRDGWWAPNHDYDGADGWCDSPEYFNPHPRQQKLIYIKPTHWMPFPPPPI